MSGLAREVGLARAMLGVGHESEDDKPRIRRSKREDEAAGEKQEDEKQEDEK